MTPMEGMKSRPEGARSHTTKHVQTLRAKKGPEVPEVFEPARLCACPHPQPRAEGSLLTCAWCTRVIERRD